MFWDGRLVRDKTRFVTVMINIVFWLYFFVLGEKKGGRKLPGMTGGALRSRARVYSIKKAKKDRINIREYMAHQQKGYFTGSAQM